MTIHSSNLLPDLTNAKVTYLLHSPKSLYNTSAQVIKSSHKSRQGKTRVHNIIFCTGWIYSVPSSTKLFVSHRELSFPTNLPRLIARKAKRSLLSLLSCYIDIKLIEYKTLERNVKCDSNLKKKNSSILSPSPTDFSRYYPRRIYGAYNKAIIHRLLPWMMALLL